MTPREYEYVLTALKEFRDEEQRQTREAIAASGGPKVVGGGTVSNN